MKRDDRDIVAQQDYTPLSNAELVAHIELYAGIMHNTPLNDGEFLSDIIDPARVLLARIEAAEAERNMVKTWGEQLTADNRRLAAKVVLLDAAYAAEKRLCEEAEARAAILAARVAELEADAEPAVDKWAAAARSETQLRLDAAEARAADLATENESLRASLTAAETDLMRRLNEYRELYVFVDDPPPCEGGDPAPAA